jgi:hypothetical protein
VKARDSEVVSLTLEQARQAVESGLVSVVVEEPPHCWRLETDSKVGRFVGDGFQMRVDPRLSVPKLMFLLA